MEKRIANPSLSQPKAPILPSVSELVNPQLVRESDLELPQIQVPSIPSKPTKSLPPSPLNPLEANKTKKSPIVNVKRGRGGLVTPSTPSQLRYETSLEESTEKETEEIDESKSTSRVNKRRFQPAEKPTKKVNLPMIVDPVPSNAPGSQQSLLRGEERGAMANLSFPERVRVGMSAEIDRALVERGFDHLDYPTQISILKSTLLEQVTQIKLTLLSLEDKENIYKSRVRDLEGRVRFVENRERENVGNSQLNMNILFENCASSHRRVEELEHQLDAERRTVMELRRELWERSRSPLPGIQLNSTTISNQDSNREPHQDQSDPFTEGHQILQSQNEAYYPPPPNASQMLPSGLVGYPDLNQSAESSPVIHQFTSPLDQQTSRFQSKQSVPNLSQPNQTSSVFGQPSTHGPHFGQRTFSSSFSSNPVGFEGGDSSGNSRERVDGDGRSNESGFIQLSRVHGEEDEGQRSRRNSTTSEDLAFILGQEPSWNSSLSSNPSVPLTRSGYDPSNFQQRQGQSLPEEGGSSSHVRKR